MANDKPKKRKASLLELMVILLFLLSTGMYFKLLEMSQLLQQIAK